MIQSKEEYRYYREADRISLGIQGSWLEALTDDVWRFERLLRHVEYYENCKRSLLWKPYRVLQKIRLQRASIRYGFNIPLNVFGPGLSIGHPGPITINPGAKIGKNCRIHTCVSIATRAGSTQDAPTIGDNVYIGPGAKIFGPIEIADNIAIGANAVVGRSFTEPGITIAGVPARKIGDKGSQGLVIEATELVDTPPFQ